MAKVSYLSTLRFDPGLKNKWWAKYIVNIRLVLLLILSIVAIGSFSFFTIPRRLNPEVKIPIVVISTVLPGASPADIESLVTIPLEDKVNNVKGLDTMVSSSRDNVSVIQLQFLSNVNGDKALQDVQTALGGNLTLPDEAQDPSVTLVDFEDQPVWEFAVTTKADTASLMRFSRQLRDKLKDLPKVDRVMLSGFDTQEIQIVVDPVKVAEFGINPALLSQLVKQATSSFPAGTIQTSNSSFALSIDKDVTGITDLRDLRLTAPGGRTFLLSDIAAIIERSKVNQPKTYLTYPDGKPQQAVSFFVFKSKSVNIDASEKDAKKVVDETLAQYNGEFTVTTILNTAEEIVKQFNELYSEFQSTILLVFILLLIFLGFKQAIISSLTVPLTFLSAFTIISGLGLSLNFLTMFAFLLSLGLLIDDTIVTVAAMTRYYRIGKFTAEETGALVWRDFIVPLWSTTITTIWAFVPLLIATGIIGEFIKSIPIVVTATMLSSTSIAVLITLPLMIVILKPNIPHRVKVLLLVLGVILVISIAAVLIPQSVIYPLVLLVVVFVLFMTFQVRRTLVTRLHSVGTNGRYTRFVERFNNGFINIEVLSERYKSVIDRILRSRPARRGTLLAIIIFAIIGYSLVGFGFVKSEFFPKSDEDILYIQVALPAGTNVATTNSEMLSFIERVKQTEAVTFIVADSGVSYDPNMGGRDNDSGAFLLTMHLIPNEKREITTQELSQRLRDQLKTYTRGTVSVLELSGGPPAGADVQISFLGDDLAVLDRYATTMMDFLKKQPGVTNVTSSNKASTSKIVFVPDKVKMVEAGVTSDVLGLWLRTYASGFTLDTLKVNNEDTDITFQLGKQAPTPQSLSSITLPSPNGQIPLLSLGSLRLTTNPTSISREDGKRRITVSAGVTQGVSATEKNKDVERYADSLDLPDGYIWQTGGVNEENEKSVQSILQAMLISFLLILITMVIEFGSYRQTLIAMLIIPLSIAGVFYIFALTNTPLSFPALIGILALFGIVVTHAIVVIEKINDNRKHGMNLHDSLVDAAGNRLEPVLLTSMATIVGLIPITLSDPLWRGLGGAIISGLLFSGAIKLFFVPVMYYNWFHEEEKRGSTTNRKITERL